MRTFNTSVAWLASLLLLVIEATPASAELGNVEAGRKLAERLCAACHAIGATGVSKHAEAPPFREIAAKYDVWQLDEAFAEGIVVGHQDMPTFEFQATEVADLLTFLDSVGPKSTK